jgi:hypothetical protein
MLSISSGLWSLQFTRQAPERERSVDSVLREIRVESDTSTVGIMRRRTTLLLVHALGTML